MLLGCGGSDRRLNCPGSQFNRAGLFGSSLPRRWFLEGQRAAQRKFKQETPELSERQHHRYIFAVARDDHRAPTLSKLECMARTPSQILCSDAWGRPAFLVQDLKFPRLRFRQGAHTLLFASHVS